MQKVKARDAKEAEEEFSFKPFEALASLFYDDEDLQALTKDVSEGIKDDKQEPESKEREAGAVTINFGGIFGKQGRSSKSSANPSSTKAERKAARKQESVEDSSADTDSDDGESDD